MKIAMLSSDYLPAIGGIATHVHQLASSLVELGHQVEVWYWARAGEVVDQSTMGDIPVRILQGGAPGASSIRHARRLAQSAEDLHREFPAEVLHLHTLDALLPAMRHLRRRRFPAKLVWTNHTSRFLRKSRSRLWRLKMAFQAAPLDGFLTASGDRMEASSFLPTKHRLNVPNGVDVETFAGGCRETARDQLGIDPDRFVMLYTGRFAPVKGVGYLADALVRMGEANRDFLCIFCGNLPDDRESAAVVRTLEGGGVSDLARFEGFIPNKELKLYLAACDVLVLPSLMEATSISCLEAMAAGRAVVGTRIGGIAELVIEGETGMLVEPQDSEELAQQLLQAQSRRDLDSLGKNGYLRVIEKFTWRRTAEQVASFYQQL